MGENYKIKYLMYKSKYLNLKEHVNDSGPTGAFFFITTDVPHRGKAPVCSVLLTLERRNESGLEYSLPGGTIDSGYDAWETANKELLEETGMNNLPKMRQYPHLAPSNRTGCAKTTFIPRINQDVGNVRFERRVYMTHCNYKELYYNPSNVKNNETVGMVLFPCEDLIDIINDRKRDNVTNLRIRRDVKDCLIKILNNGYLDSSYNIIKTDN
jgi:8-oxo-dGTP pyrophosphatase MutT (NUDIX family)